MHHGHDHLGPTMGATDSRTMAVMVTDVVESTRLRSAVGDEEATRLIMVLSSIVANAVTAHDGVVRRGTGDGDRSTFSSVRAALRTAGAIQGLLARRPLAASDGAVVQLRVGICVGEVDLDESGAIGGAPVRGADRVADRAPVGGIALCPIAATMMEDAGDLEVVDATDHAIQLRPNLESPSATLPGRGDELTVVREALDALAQRQGGMLIVSGEVGSGRSRMLDEAAASAENLGLRTLRHGCLDGGERPWATLVGLLHDAIGKVDADTIKEAAGDDGLVLTAILPELARVLGVPPAPGRRLPDEPLIERSLTRFLFRAASRRPLLLIIDDLDQADEGSRNVMARLAAHLRDLGVLVLASAREPATREPNGSWARLSRLVRAGQATNVHLAPLDGKRVREVLHHLAPAPANRRRVREVLDRTGGNVALIAALVDAARSAGVDVVDVEAPESALTPLRATLAQLGDAGVEALQVLALRGQPTSLGLLVILADHADDDVLAGIERAEQLALVVVDEVDEDFVVRFRHGLVSELLLDQLGGATRARLSRLASVVDRDAA